MKTMKIIYSGKFFRYCYGWVCLVWLGREKGMCLKFFYRGRKNKNKRFRFSSFKQQKGLAEIETNYLEDEFNSIPGDYVELSHKELVMLILSARYRFLNNNDYQFFLGLKSLYM